jgi:hypothetical protein
MRRKQNVVKSMKTSGRQIISYEKKNAVLNFIVKKSKNNVKR